MIMAIISAFLESSFVAASDTHGVASVLLRRRHRINTPEKPCMEDKEYSILKCTEDFVAKTIGCSSPWTNIEARQYSDQY